MSEDRHGRVSFDQNLGDSLDGCRLVCPAGDECLHATARRHCRDGQGASPSTAAPIRIASIRDWARFDAEARPWGGSNGVAIDGDGRSVWAIDRCSPGNDARLSREQGQSGPPFRRVREGGQELWRRDVRVAARHPRRSRRQCLGDRLARRQHRRTLTKFPGEGNKGSVVVKFSPEGKVLMTLGKPGVRGNPPDALTDPTDVVTDPGQRRRVRRRESYRRRRSQPGRPHLGVRPERQVPPRHREDWNGTGRVPHAARARVRFAGPADRGRSTQPPHPDPDQGREVRRRVSRVRPDERPGHRQERRDLHGRLGIDRTRASRLAARDPDRQPQGRQGDDVHPGRTRRRTRPTARWAKASPSMPPATSTPRKRNCEASRST